MPRTKGTNLIDMVKYLRSRRDEARDALPEHLHHYLEDQIDVASWYPDEDRIGLVRGLAKIIPSDGVDPLETIARINARQHMIGVYGHLLEDAEPSALPIRAGTLWKTMHDAGDLQIRMGEVTADVELSGWDAPSHEMCMMVGPYLSELFALSGLQDVTVEKTACVRKEAPSCRWQIGWSAEKPDA